MRINETRIEPGRLASFPAKDPYGGAGFTATVWHGAVSSPPLVPGLNRVEVELEEADAA